MFFQKRKYAMTKTSNELVVECAHVSSACATRTHRHTVKDTAVPLRYPNSFKTTTMNKKQRKLVKDGAAIVAKQDKAMWSALSSNGIAKKCLLAVTMFSNTFGPYS